MPVSRCHNIADLRELARRRLPAPIFHYLHGGAEDEWTQAANTRAFDAYPLLPSCLNDVSRIELETRVFGQRLRWPVMLSPTGMNRLFHHHGERAVARAAASTGTLHGLSTMATTSLEEIATIAGDAPRMFQVYIFKDRGLTAEFLQRCRAAGYQVLCLTVDTPVAGNRERDRRSGFTMPPRPTLGSLRSFMMRPGWLVNLLRCPDFRLANVAHRVDALGRGPLSIIDYVNSQFDPSVTWRDVEWLQREWNGPLVLKGVQAPADARRAADMGLAGVMVSNHGGPQLDGAAAAVDCIPRIVDAAGDRLDVVLDGGVRRGSHVVKALALGAKACSIGRPYLYGLAAGGESGVVRAIEILREEVRRTMALLGVTSVQQLSKRFIHRHPLAQQPPENAHAQILRATCG